MSAGKHGVKAMQVGGLNRASTWKGRHSWSGGYCTVCSLRKGSARAKGGCSGHQVIRAAPTFKCDRCNHEHSSWETHRKSAPHRAALLRKELVEEGVYTICPRSCEHWRLHFGEPFLKYFPTALTLTGLLTNDLWIRRDLLELTDKVNNAIALDIERLKEVWVARAQQIVIAYTRNKWTSHLHQELRTIEAYNLEFKIRHPE